jgi:hypothetical protein
MIYGIDKIQFAHKSTDLKITADRITMLQRSNGTESAVTIIDLMYPDGTGAGTK